MGTLGWTSMCPGACPRKTSAWTQFGNTLKNFASPKQMEVRAYFDLLKSFRQGTRRIDEWYNVVQAQINLAKYPPETAKILHRDICWFFLKDEEFVSKMINEGTMDLDKFPASRVHQPAKKMESSKARARHIKQVAGDPQATQINPMHHQHTELANGKYKKKKSSAKQKQVQHKNVEQRPPNQYKKSFDPTLAHKNKDRCSKCGDSADLEGFQCPARNSTARHGKSLAITQAFASRNPSKNKPITNTGNPLHINWRLGPYMHIIAMRKQIVQMTHSAYSWRSNVHKHTTRWPKNLHAWLPT